MRNKNAAKDMRELSDDERDNLIELGKPVVVDSRPIFDHKIKQRELAKSYKYPKKPEE